MPQRRDFLKGLGGATIALAGESLWPKLVGALGGDYDALAAAPLELLPGKKPLIRRTYRPPNFETPVHYFNEVFTPNDAFFVRYHLANIPRIDSKSWRLRVEGDAVKKVSEFSIETLLRSFERVEIAAVNQCAGNRRGLFEPRAPGVQWGHGAMGNARWSGVRLG
ncbi:MAG: molybdopterin-dependent oxidoreductase, partial [Gammaproteobacteria bacterium]